MAGLPLGESEITGKTSWVAEHRQAIVNAMFAENRVQIHVCQEFENETMPHALDDHADQDLPAPSLVFSE